MASFSPSCFRSLTNSPPEKQCQLVEAVSLLCISIFPQRGQFRDLALTYKAVTKNSAFRPLVSDKLAPCHTEFLGDIFKILVDYHVSWCNPAEGFRICQAVRCKGGAKCPQFTESRGTWSKWGELGNTE